MIEQRHRIKRQILEIRTPNPEQARHLQAELSHVHGQRIAPLIDRVCSELSAPNRFHRIESLALDLGTIDTHNFADSYVAMLERALRRALVEEIRASERSDSERDQDPQVGSHIDLIELFARTGTLPWWADISSNHVPHACMQALLASAPHALARLVRDLVSEPAAAWRLVHCSDDAILVELVTLLAPRTGRELVALARELPGLLQASCPVANMPAKRWRQLLWQHILRVAAHSAFGNSDSTSAAHGQAEHGTRYVSQTLPSDNGSTSEPHAFVNNALVQMALALGVTYRGLIVKLYEYVETHTKPVSRSMRDAIATAYHALPGSPAEPARSPSNPPLAHQEPRGSTPRPYDTSDSEIQVHREPTRSNTASLAHLLAALRARAHHPAAAGESDDQWLASSPVAGLETALSQQHEEALAQLLVAFETLTDRSDTGASLSISHDQSAETTLEAGTDAASAPDTDLATDAHADAETDANLAATGIETEARDTTLADRLHDPFPPMSIGATSDLERLLERAIAQGTITPELLEQCMAALHRHGATDPVPRVRSELQRILQQTLTRARVALSRDPHEVTRDTQTAPRQPAKSLGNDRLTSSQRTGHLPRSPSHIQRAHRQQARQRRLSALDEFYVNNSGLVILWPFLDRFFTRAGLLADKRFIDDPAAQRAVGVLQYLSNPSVFEGDEPPEYILPLNKILCGIEVDEVFDFGPPLSDIEIEECDNLLNAAIHNAPILRDMSMQGFRGTFLLRDGVLRSRDGAWLLNVERQTYDVVLDRFPWAWTWVKLPWMQTPLRVEW